MSSRSSSCKVFVGRIPHDARRRDLENFFKDHGFSKCIRDINMKVGFAFVEFDEYRDADDAVFELHHKDLLGSRIALEHAKPNKEKYGSPYNTDYRVIVENLSTKAGWQDLKDYFRQTGEVTFTKCHRENVGEGVVEFARYSDVKESIRKLDGTELMGKRIRLIDDTPKDMRKGRSASRSRSRSRSPRKRSYDRSRSRSPRKRSYDRSRSRSRSRSPAAKQD
eukprot:Seg1836.6 transcript_id=Seg1836.6/GoldUCD/mRNA.D3Y31 product="Serine/arginine-rich splicing factor 4" protein_id=Seg1836.6/GoldUCD/D3Y31